MGSSLWLMVHHAQCGSVISLVSVGLAAHRPNKQPQLLNFPDLLYMYMITDSHTSHER